MPTKKRPLSEDVETRPKRATAPRKSAAKKTAAASKATSAPKKTATKRSAAKSAPKKTATQTRGNGQDANLEPGKLSRDYADARRALGTLWEDVTKQTYSAFNNIAGRVEKNFNSARQNISEIDVRYALEKTGDKLKSVAKSGQAQVVLMAKQARLLYQMLKDSVDGKFKVPWATVSAVTAALLYFISPIDILPDFIPGAGLIDDALVISMAVSMARMDLKRYIARNKLKESEFGL